MKALNVTLTIGVFLWLALAIVAGAYIGERLP